MKFDNKNYEQLTKDQKRNYIITFARYINDTQGHLVTLQDIISHGISKDKFYYLFEGIQKLNEISGFVVKRRSLGMDDELLKKYIEKIAIITESGCWITNQLTHGNQNRPMIAYKGKRWKLARLAYKLFKEKTYPQH